jgi:DNA-directed RNA polymerase specialized sigma24 family protein
MANVSAASMARQDRHNSEVIADVIAEHRPRLRNFIRKRVPNDADVEDVLQDVFYKLVEANRLLVPIEYVTGWLFQVAAQSHHRHLPQKVARNF